MYECVCVHYYVCVCVCVQEFDNEGFLECIKDLVRVDRDWVPAPSDTIKQPSLYIRPTFIGTEVCVCVCV